ncbi:MAG: hypothetical protein K9M56_10210 [Victivallales bacterium]|nr:hypothetical protein [Victivallales bacterium]
MRRKIKKYFTLMEMVVALAVFMILIAIVLTFYETVFEVSSTSRNSSNVFSNARVALDIISRDIQCIYYKNEMTPFWNVSKDNAEAAGWDKQYQNDLIAFVSATPLPQNEGNISPLCEIKYQLFNDPDLSEDTAGWLLRSATGDNSDSWNFQYNFTAGGTGAGNAFTADNSSSEPYHKLIPNVTDLKFTCRGIDGSSLGTSAAGTTLFPYSISVELTLMDDVSWKKYITGGADKELIEQQNSRTFTKTIFVGEHGQ